MQSVNQTDPSLSMEFLPPFEEVYKQYQPLLLGTLKKLHIYQDYEDYLQEASCALWEAYQRFQPNSGAFPAYAAKYVRGRVMTLLSKQNKHKDCFPLSQWVREEGEFTVEFVDHSAEVSFSSIEGEELLASLRQMLSAKEFVAIYADYFLGLSQSELARREGVALETVKTWKKRGMKKLRTKMSPHFE